MENLDDSRDSPKVFLVGRQFKECFCTAFVEEAVEERLITVKERIEFVRKCKNHMKIRGINHFRPAFVHPNLLEDSLTFRTVPVPAGIIMNLHLSALRTLAHIAAELAGFAVTNSAGSFVLYIRQIRCHGDIILIGFFKYLSDMILTHEGHLPCGQKD